LEFYVRTIDHGGQESIISEIVIYDITIGITESQQQLSAKIYPNPSSGAVNISMQVQQAGVYTLNIINMQGELLQTLYNGNLPGGNKIISWDGTSSRGEQIPPGIYFVQLRGEGGMYTEKIVLLGE